LAGEKLLSHDFYKKMVSSPYFKMAGSYILRSELLTGGSGSLGALHRIRVAHLRVQHPMYRQGNVHRQRLAECGQGVAVSCGRHQNAINTSLPTSTIDPITTEVTYE
jgi:hypothetical protein